MNFMTEVVDFKTIKDFEAWKTEYEENLRCRYVIKSGMLKNKVGANVTYWQCNRSVFYKCKRQGKRKTKSSGTTKIDNNCTATLKVVYHDNNSLTVCADHTHYGHKKELQHVPLSHRVRRELASKLHRGMSKENILDEVRNQICGTELQRIHLVDKRDLGSISKAFGINSIQYSPHDQESVAAWLAEWE